MLKAWPAPDVSPAAIPDRRAVRRLLSFAAIGAVCTAVFALVYALLRSFLLPVEANVLALSTTILLNFLANRRLTFAAHDGPLARQAGAYVVAYLFGLASSSAVLWLSIEALHPHGPGEVLLAVAASSLATVIRFVLMAKWVFAGAANHAHSAGGTVDG